ncbi:MAG: efflux RND transporter periplasmic adaptor subunit [Bacteroidota bacterium]
MNRTLTVGLAIGFVILAALGSSAISGMKPPAEQKEVEKVVKQVKTQLVKNGALVTSLEITGRLQARQKVEVFAEVGGTLLPNGNRFKEGNYFQKGQTLAKIDNEEQTLNLLAQKSGLMNQITLMLPDLKTDYPRSFPAWESYLQGMDVNAKLPPLPDPISDQEKYFISARNLYNLYYSIQSQEKRMEKYHLMAPFNGVLSGTNITEGTLVRAGQKMGDFMNAWSFDMEAAVNEADIDLIQVGNKVELFSDNSDQSWKGTVSRISRVVDPATQTIKVFISTSGKGLKEGMYVSGEVKGRSVPEAFEISRNLLVNQNQVFLVENNALKLAEVEPVHLTTQSAIVKGLPEAAVLLNEVVAGGYEGMEVETY